MKIPRARNCKVCGQRFKPGTVMQWWCCDEHKIEYAIQISRKQRSSAVFAAGKVEAAESKKKKLSVKPLSYFAKQAQAAFNAYIRERDKDDPCISCQRFHDGQYHAGHFFTVGARPEIRFHEDNCHKQCSVCNNHLSGNIDEYLPNLILKIGQERFDNLRSHRKVPKLTRGDYERKRDEYRVKLKCIAINEND